MASVVITFKIMPDSPETDLGKILTEATRLVAEFGGEVGRHSEEPIGFGLKALKLIFVMDEKIGTTDDLEAQIKEIEGVTGCDCVDVRRSIG